MSVTNKELLQIYKSEFIDALSTLEHSWNKIKERELPNIVIKNLDDFETWEAFTARFARCTDIFLSKYIRLEVLRLDPGFRGEMRDYLDKAEKANLISSADKWMSVRELRNKISHEYTKEDILTTLKDVTKHCPFVIDQLQVFKK